MVRQKETPIWQPLEMLPLIKDMVEGTYTESNTLLADLSHFEDIPGGLDDHTVERTIRCYTEQKGHILHYAEQLRRWKEDPSLSEKQRKEIGRLEKKLVKLIKTNDSILALAEKLRSQTIENFLQKDDLELAMDFLLGKIGAGVKTEKNSSRNAPIPFPQPQRPTPLVLNRRFIDRFTAEISTCFALGILEHESVRKGFIAMNPGKAIPPAVSARGFNFGQQVFTYPGAELIHFIMRFYDYQDYHMFLNPNHDLVRTVLGKMVEVGEYFFLVYDTGNGLSAFRETLSPGGSLMESILETCRSAATQMETYNEAVVGLRREYRKEGVFLEWVCRDPEFLNLNENRFEIAPV